MDYSLPGSLSMQFPSKEYWSRLPFPSPGDLPNPGIEPSYFALQAVSCIAGGFFTGELLRKPQHLDFIKFTSKKLKDIFHFMNQAAGGATSEQKLSAEFTSGANLRSVKKLSNQDKSYFNTILKNKIGKPQPSGQTSGFSNYIGSRAGIRVSQVRQQNYRISFTTVFT